MARGPAPRPTEDGCSCEDRDCTSVGKYPRTWHGHKDATTAKEMIALWWSFAHIGANVGIRTGQESGLVVLDVDPRHGGDETLCQLEAKYGPLPETPTVQSGGGGRHFYFLHPGFYVRSVGKTLGAGLDIKGDRGSIVAPPSLHVSGGRCQWMKGRTPTAVQVAPVPEWMLPLLQEPSRPGSRGSAGRRGSWSIGKDGLIPAGQRNETLFKFALSLYRANLSDNVICEELVDWNMKYCAPH